MKKPGNNKEAVLSRDFQIRSYEVGPGNKIAVLTYLNFLQDAAGDQAEKLGVSFPSLLKKNRTWILSRYNLEIYRYPAWKERITVTTWPSGKERAFFLREFEVFSTDGNPLLRASSAWIMFDLSRRRPVRPGGFMESFPIDPRRATPGDFSPIGFPDDQPPLKKTFTVRADEVDLNNHLNHPYYIVFALENVPEEERSDEGVLWIRASFRHPAFRGERISVLTVREERETGPVFFHRVAREADGKELARVETGWKDPC